MSLREKLAAVDDRKKTTIHIEEWGFDVDLVEPSAGEALKLHKKNHDEVQATWELLSLCIYDEGGRVFSSASQAEKALSDKGMASVTALSVACKKFLGIGVEEDAAKNSEEIQSEGFSSD